MEQKNHRKGFSVLEMLFLILYLTLFFIAYLKMYQFLFVKLKKLQEEVLNEN